MVLPGIGIICVTRKNVLYINVIYGNRVIANSVVNIICNKSDGFTNLNNEILINCKNYLISTKYKVIEQFKNEIELLQYNINQEDKCQVIYKEYNRGKN